MTDHADPAEHPAEHHEPREVRVAEPHGHDARPAAEDAAAHDEHEAHEAALGPIDVTAWGVGLLGVLIGVITAACFAIATGYWTF